MARPSRYTDEQKSEAIAAYEQYGAAEASRRLGMSSRQILRWTAEAGRTSRAGIEQVRQARATASEHAAAEWSTFRSREATGAGATAARARRAVYDAIEAGQSNAARQYAITYGILIDKAEVLSGNTQDRIETWSTVELDRDLHALVADMESVIRAGGNGQRSPNGHGD